MGDPTSSLKERLTQRFKHSIACRDAFGETTLEIAPNDLLQTCKALRDEPEFAFDQLIDLCAVDYLAHGNVEWETTQATGLGFSRGVHRADAEHAGISRDNENATTRRFAVVYHLMSIKNNNRLRIKCFLPSENPMIDTVVDIWPSVNWFEREAFDLFGILFRSHPDLRRILTDYGFIGHPFRKDFPLIGNVEMRYDNEKQRVVYEPVSIEPRTLVPRVHRDDHRYVSNAPEEE